MGRSLPAPNAPRCRIVRSIKRGSRPAGGEASLRCDGVHLGFLSRASVVEMTKFIVRSTRGLGKPHLLVAAGACRRAAVLLIEVGAVVLALTGCGAGGMTLEQFNESYEQALQQSGDSAVALTENRGEVLQRLREYFAEMTEVSVREATARVYAEDAYLNDNLTVVHGARAIETYFAGTVALAESVSVRFLDVAAADIDYYVRWEMVIRSQGIKGGEPIRSFGVTQFRFNGDGKVILHRDFWDSSSGLFEHVPVLGWLIKKARHRVESAVESSAP